MLIEPNSTVRIIKSELEIDYLNQLTFASKEAQEDLAHKISGWWKQFHAKRKTQIATANELMKYIYLNQADRNKNKK